MFYIFEYNISIDRERTCLCDVSDIDVLNTDIDGLVQDRSISSVLAVEIL